MDNKHSYTPQPREVIMLLNGFQIILSLYLGVLTIEAEEQGSNPRFFTTRINDDEVEGQTKSRFSDCLTLQQGLKDALTRTDQTVKFTDEAKLFYFWETQYESTKKCFEFAIPLNEVQLDPFKILERKNANLQKKVEEQEVIITQLKNQNVNKEILDKIADLEKNLLEEKSEVKMQGKIQKLERLITDMLINPGRRCDIHGIRNSTHKKITEIYQFNTESKNAKAFDFSNNNQSVTLNLNLNEEAYRAISSDRPLPKTRTSFSVKIDESKINRVLIGIIPANRLQSALEDFTSMETLTRTLNSHLVQLAQP